SPCDVSNPGRRVLGQHGKSGKICRTLVDACAVSVVNTPYSDAHETEGTDRVKNKHLYSASANEIDEKKPELKELPSHLEYAYQHDNKSFPIIVSSKLSEEEKISLLQIRSIDQYRVLGLRIRSIGSLDTEYWVFRYEVLAENVFLLIVDQSIIYGVSADVDTTYSSKSDNGLEFFKVFRYGIFF
nr:hypothetical protein [Tanacetum cinerariifolium]